MNIAPVHGRREVRGLAAVPGYLAIDADVDRILRHGEWGAAIRAKFVAAGEVGLLEVVSDAAIGAVFRWAADFPPALLRNERARGIVKNFLKLLDLPTARSMVAKAIELCVQNRKAGNAGIYTICFSGEGDNSFAYDDDDRNNCIIRVAADPVLGEAFEDSVPILVWDNTSNKIGIKGVTMPQPLPLTHEFGHLLYALKTPLPRRVDSDWWLETENRAQREYNEIFNGIIGNVGHGDPPYTPAEDLFLDCWNHGEFTEILNILPDADMLRNPGSRLRISDGILIKEALDGPWRADKKPRFFDEDGNIINVVHDDFPSTRFVRFSHMGWEDFSARFADLDEENKNKFEGYTEMLLREMKTARKVGRRVSVPLRPEMLLKV
jgi:hypothetical protein